MRFATVFALLVLPISASAQPSPCPNPHPFPLSSWSQFDPYKPSHLTLLRNYGATMLAGAPLDSLLRLDPYVPSDGERLRQLGGAIPVWFYQPLAWPQAPLAVPHGPCVTVADPASVVLTTFSDVLAALETTSPARAGGSGPADRNRGISLEYEGRVWVSAGPAVAFNESAFVRAGERAGTPVYRRTGAEDDLIYIRTMAGVAAPFRAVR